MPVAVFHFARIPTMNMYRHLIKQGKQDAAAVCSITDKKNTDKLGDVLKILISGSLSLACQYKSDIC